MHKISRDEKNKNKDSDFYRLSRFDGILIGLILFFSIAAIFWISHSYSRQTSEARVALIYQEGRLIERVALERDKTVKLDSKMEIEVKAGRVRVKSSDCPHHICMNMGWIEYAGQTIICVPNKVLVEIKSSGLSMVDAVSY